MYLPKHFAEPRLEVLHELMQRQPLATIITLNQHGINANHIPLYLDPQAGEFGTLYGHVARANSIWQEHSSQHEILAIFHGSDSYITPSWYASKAQTGKVVPTWNYAVAHAYGHLQVIDDPQWLRQQLEQLTKHNEASFEHQWQVGDAPHEYTEALLKAIVGIAMPITRLLGKWKVSQNQPHANQQSVIAGLEASNEPTASAMIELIKQRQS
ncbi:FMN-binding negative transcriptional regulator [Herpetosiphon llansteffanensis]|uniref:FMN-binding negative transcriptional regulator n=1 Tax=Herpetosiphon llansteffanensis TaxID=2094568 RepID=UPI000D7BE056|nr:FMN-binding negative transcriptional regulator [Herpetosiphon llansteffanensis]